VIGGGGRGRRWDSGGRPGGTIPHMGADGGATGRLTTADCQLAVAQAAAAAIVDRYFEEDPSHTGALPRAPGDSSAAATGFGGSGALETVRDASLAVLVDNSRDSGKMMRKRAPRRLRARATPASRPSSDCGASGRSPVCRPPTPLLTSKIPTLPKSWLGRSSPRGTASRCW